MAVNLQQLPPHVLEKIFSYCADRTLFKAKNLAHLTECSKFLRDFIESSPSLMARLRLRVAIDAEIPLPNLDCSENLSACLASTRSYTDLLLTMSDVA